MESVRFDPLCRRIFSPSKSKKFIRNLDSTSGRGSGIDSVARISDGAFFTLKGSESAGFKSISLLLRIRLIFYYFHLSRSSTFAFVRKNYISRIYF